MTLWKKNYVKNQYRKSHKTRANGKLMDNAKSRNIKKNIQ